MIEFPFNAQRMAQALDNVELFYDAGSKIAKDQIFFDFHDTGLAIWSCDDYVVAREFVEYAEAPTTEEFPSISFSGTSVFGEKAGNKVVVPGILQNARAIGTGKKQFVLAVDPEWNGIPEWVRLSQELLRINPWEDPDDNRENPGIISIRPERLQNIARVKAPKDAPLDMAFAPGYRDTSPVGMIKLGPTFRAVIQFVDREQAARNLGDLTGEYMW